MDSQYRYNFPRVGNSNQADNPLMTELRKIMSS
jgi:hypothetical protein